MITVRLLNKLTTSLTLLVAISAIHNPDDDAMCNEKAPDMIDVEIGRLNLVLREILSDLGIPSSTEPSSDDEVFVFSRSSDGHIRMIERESSVVENGLHNTLIATCHAIVAGVNVVGNVAVRIRLESNDPVFVSLWMET